jgi:hypothetical protein
MGRARGMGIAICDGREHASHIDRQVASTRDKAKRNAVSVEHVDTTDFAENELARHNIRRREVHTIEAVTKAAAKAIKADPPPVVGDNVRVLKRD